MHDTSPCGSSAAQKKQLLSRQVIPNLMSRGKVASHIGSAASLGKPGCEGLLDRPLEGWSLCRTRH